MASSRTNRVLIGAAALLCLAAGAAAIYLYHFHGMFLGNAGKTPYLLSELPAGAPVVVYIDVAALKKSQNLLAAFGLLPDKAASPGDRDYQEFVRGTGFDYARDLDKAAVAIWPSSLTAPAGGIGGNQVMAVAEGRFDQARIEAYALRTGKPETRGNQTFYTVPGDPPVSFAFLSSTRILLASGKSLSVLAHVPSGADNQAMRARIERVAGAPVFAAARTDTLPSSFYDSLRNTPQFARLARSIQGVTLAGVPQGDAFDVTLDAECDSMPDALEVATAVEGIRMFSPMALKDPRARGSITKQQAELLAALANQVKVTQQDRWVRLTLEITPAMLTQGGGGRHARLNSAPSNQADQIRGALPSNASSSSVRIPSLVNGRGL